MRKLVTDIWTVDFFHEIYEEFNKSFLTKEEATNYSGSIADPHMPSQKLRSRVVRSLLEEVVLDGRR